MPKNQIIISKTICRLSHTPRLRPLAQNMGNKKKWLTHTAEQSESTRPSSWVYLVQQNSDSLPLSPFFVSLAHCTSIFFLSSRLSYSLFLLPSVSAVRLSVCSPCPGIDKQRKLCAQNTNADKTNGQLFPTVVDQPTDRHANVRGTIQNPNKKGNKIWNIKLNKKKKNNSNIMAKIKASVDFAAHKDTSFFRVRSPFKRPIQRRSKTKLADQLDGQRSTFFGFKSVFRNEKHEKKMANKNKDTHRTDQPKRQVQVRWKLFFFMSTETHAKAWTCGTRHAHSLVQPFAPYLQRKGKHRKFECQLWNIDGNDDFCILVNTNIISFYALMWKRTLEYPTKCRERKKGWTV